VDHYTRPDFERAALLSIDVQRDTLDGGPLSFASPTALLPHLTRVVEAFRTAGRSIVHVVRLYLPDGSNVDPCRRAAVSRGDRALVAGTPGSELVGALLPHGRSQLDPDLLLSGVFQPLTTNESVMYKPRWGAFYGTKLLAHLHEQGLTTVVVIGCNFPNCPRATVVEASERDLRVAVIADAVSRFTARDSIELRDIGVAVMSAAKLAEQFAVTTTG
jgi:nicotinamidase-related amidase